MKLSNKISEPKRKPSSFDVIKSLLAALFGVQSSKNRERDFESGNASDYIIYGIITVIIFVVIMMNVVSAVLDA